MNERLIEAIPSAGPLMTTIRGMPYTLNTAVADIIDNSIAAGAREISIVTEEGNSPEDAYIAIKDNGRGMNEDELINALRLGDISPLEHRKETDLGRYGIGLKSASVSQCRQLTVVSVREGVTSVMTWDLDLICRTNKWQIIADDLHSVPDEWLPDGNGTTVVWRKLDRVEGFGINNTKRVRTATLEQLIKHLQLTFHRFIEEDGLKILVNDRELQPWNPFFADSLGKPADFPEEYWPPRSMNPKVKIHPYVVPVKENTALFGEEDDLALQGFYIYRGRRLICIANWLGIRGLQKERQYRLARISIDFDNDADEDWRLDIIKSTARPPLEMRDWLKRFAIQARTVSEQVLGHEVPADEKAKASKSSWWQKSKSKSAPIPDFSDPVLQQIFDLLEEKVLSAPVLRGVMELLSVSHPSMAKRAKDQVLSDEAVEALTVIFHGLASAYGNERAVELLKAREPFSEWKELMTRITKVEF